MGEKEKLFPFAGKQWCQFHLPVKKDGERSKKAEWESDEIKEFNRAVFEALERPRPEEEHADLSGVVFPGSINFSKDAHGNPRTLPPVLFFNAVFHAQAWFRGATFEGIARFDEVTFHGDAQFRGATFGGDAWFEAATFKGTAGFDGARFKRIAGFDRAKFKSHAEFEGAIFKILALFGGAIFGGDTIFKGATFEANAQFYKATFKYPTHFDGGIVRGDAYFSCEVSPKEENADAFREISFAGREFHGEVKFTNRRFLDKTSFKGTVFNIAPEFHNCVLHENTDFSDPNFRDTKSDHAARAYRTLKLAMERVRARQEEADFYALEQKSLREQEATPWRAKAISFLYDWTSKYGRSAWRPFWLWLTVQAAFFGVYWGCPESPVVAGRVPEVLRFTLAQAARPFMALSPGSGGGNGELSAGIALLAGLHSFLSLSLLALLLLALRWRFRRG
jgi:hypothetical protein